MFLDRLYSVLACPETRGPIELVPTKVTRSGEIYEGFVYSLELGRAVGEIRAFQVDMVRPSRTDDLADLRGREPQVVPDRPTSRVRRPEDGGFSTEGVWTLIEPGLICNDGSNGPGAVDFEVGPVFDILFEAHPWSGLALVRIEGEPIQTVDLYNPHLAVPRTVHVNLSDRHPADARLKVRIVQGGRSCEAAFGDQVLFAGVRDYFAQSEPLVWSKPEQRKTPVFSEHFWRALDECPPKGFILDYGGGSRQIPDYRYINLDYAALSEPDVIGDGLRLPFRDNSIDIVFTSGVIEHLRDPLLAGREIARVLKPDGYVLADIAFMQPVHSEGQHYFNTTIWGIQEVFKDLEIEKVWPAGSLSWLFQWMLETAGITSRVDPMRMKTFVQMLDDFESVMPEERLLYVAPSVWLKGYKRAPK